MASDVSTFFTKLESHQTLLSKTLSLYQTLTSHLTTLDSSISSRSQTLSLKLKTLDSTLSSTLSSLDTRLASLPTRLDTLSSLITAQQQSALAEFSKPPQNDDVPFLEALTSLCRRMDAYGVLKLVVARRKESTALRSEILAAVDEAVDKERLVLDVVREFVEQKAAGKSWMTDKRWVCGVLVGGLFKPDELKKKEGKLGELGVGFSRKTKERAEGLVREWREKAEMGKEGEEGSGMAPAEASMFLQIVIGFGLRDVFEEEFYKKLLMEFASRRDMAKLAVPLFGDKLADLIDELVKKGKEVEAVYFASESGLTERFPPVTLLKSYLQRTEKKGKRGSSSTTDEVGNLEIESVKFAMKCIEDHKLEAELPLETLKKRLASLEKTKADKKKASATSGGSKPPGSKPPNKRAAPSGPPRHHHHHPAKIPRYSSPYGPFSERNPISPAEQSPGSRYAPGPYSYPTQATTYDTGIGASPYGSTYGGSYASSGPSQIGPRHYSGLGEGLGGGGPNGGLNGGGEARIGGSYGGSLGSYGSYTAGAGAGAGAPSTHAYLPSSYIL